MINVLDVFDEEMEKYFLAFSLKYDNDFEKILSEMDKKTLISSEEIEELTKNVEEKYVVFMSKNYPMYFRSFEQPPIVLFYEGNIELFNKNGETFENPLDSANDFYLALNEDGGQCDWCIAVKHEKDLFPVVERFISDLDGKVDLKRYREESELKLL